MAAQVDFYNMLSGLGDTIVAQRKDNARKEALAIASTPGPDGTIDFQKAILGLANAGDLQGAQVFAQLRNRQEDQARQARQDAFQREESARAQKNADRSYGLQVRSANRADEDKFGIKEVTDPTTGATSFVKYNTRTGDVVPTGPQAPPSTPANPFAYPGAKPQTEAQSKDSGYANRLFRSEQILRDPSSIDAATSLTQKGLDAVPIAGNYMTSPAFQKFDQAKRDFVNAVLRRESGAAISQSEFDNANKQYFPQPGDSKERIAEKQRNRQDTIAGIAGGGGPNYRPQYSFGADGELVPTGAGKQGAAAGPAPPKVGELKDGWRYKGGNPADPNSWVKAQ